MNKLLKIIVAALILLPLASCSEDDKVLDEVVESALIATSTDMPESEMVDMAMLSRFIDKTSETSRGFKEYTVETICDDAGSPLIYAVNFVDGGFKLISARQSSAPVLAFSEEGSYHLDDLNSNAEFYLSLMKETVAAEASLPADSTRQNRLAWQLATHQNVSALSTNPQSRSASDDWPDYVKEQYNQSKLTMMDSISKWTTENKNVYFPQDIYSLQLDESIKQQVLEACQSCVYYWFEEQWEDFAMILIHGEVNESTVGNMIKTKWGQGTPYNRKFPSVAQNKLAYVGCWSIAASQIMRYYEHPKNRFNWSQMPNVMTNQDTDDLPDYLYYVSSHSNPKYTVDGTPIHDKDIVSTVKSLGYNSQGPIKISDFSQLKNYIVSGKPCALTGGDGNGEAHAWVASGFSSAQSWTYIDVYTLVRPCVYQMSRIVTANNLYQNNLYMVWGWKGTSDGFYGINSNFTFSKNLEFYIFTPNE